MDTPERKEVSESALANEPFCLPEHLMGLRGLAAWENGPTVSLGPSNCVPITGDAYNLTRPITAF